MSEAAGEQDNFKEGAIGFNGYGFVFKKLDYISQDSFVIGDGSSKLCSIGAFKDIYKKALELQKKMREVVGDEFYKTKMYKEIRAEYKRGGKWKFTI